MRFKSWVLLLSLPFIMAMVPGRGHLKFDESFKDAGEVKQGNVEHYEFPFSNTGDKKVKISSVISGTEGVILHLADSIIEPDNSSLISVDFDTRKRKPGDFSLAVTVNSNADNKEVKLKIFGTLVETH